MTRTTSFSQSNMFLECPRSWYYKYIKKIPADADYTYANAGKTIHECLEHHYKNHIDLEPLKEFFNKCWLRYKLDASIVAHKKDSYWLMVVNGVNLEKKFTSIEMKLYYPDAVAYLDGVNSNDDEIIDWKSSTRSRVNEADYTKQMLFYSLLYYRKFERIPKRAVIYYLKTNQELVVEPTQEDITKIEQWHNDVLKQMDECVENPSTLPPFNQSYFWSPYKHLWAGEDTVDLNYTIHEFGNFLKLEGPVSDLLKKGIEKKFTYELKNSKYIKRSNPNASTTVSFWKHRQKQLPIGFKNQLIKTLRDYAEYKKVKIFIDMKSHKTYDESKIDMPEKFLNGVTLRDYQTDAVDALLRRQNVGILEIGTGGGKTEIAIECIRRLAAKTLFIVDKKEMLKQTKVRIENALGIKVGQVGAGEDDVQHVTVATIQTLVKHTKKYEEYLKNVRFAIFDETHKVAAKSYWKVAAYLLNTEYRLGISGTAYRDDGNDMMINGIVGDKIYDLSSKVLIENGWLVRPTIIFYNNYMEREKISDMEKEARGDLINETPKYQEYYETFISNNTFRNNLIEKITTEFKDKKVLILTKLVNHGKYFEKAIPNSRHLYGSTSKKEREEIFDAFANGELNVLISTISIFAEGINVPMLGVVINASANKGDVKTIQVLGRVLRKLEGKEDAKYIDFIDETRFFRLASLSRKAALEKEGHIICVEAKA